MSSPLQSPDLQPSSATGGSVSGVIPQPKVEAIWDPSVQWADVRRITVLALPAMLAFLTQTLVNVVDTYFFGLLEEPARSDGQAMLSLSLPVLWAVAGFFSAVAVGTQALVGRRVGANRLRDAGHVAANGLLLSVLAGTVASVVGWAMTPWLFDVASSDADFIRLGSVYTRWRFVGVTSMIVTNVYKAFFDGTARTYVHLVAAIVMNIANVVLAWLLVFGHAGFPAMGVEGAGIAAAASSWLGVGVMVAFSLRRSDQAHYGLYRWPFISPDTLRTLVRLSVPSGIASTVVMTGFVLFRQIVQALDSAHFAHGGQESIYGAATTIILELASLVFFSALAFGVATATLVAQALGSGSPERAERYAWTSVFVGSTVFGAVGIVSFLFPHTLIGAFNNSPLVIEAGVPAFKLVSLSTAFIATGLTLTQALFGAGATRFVMILELVLHFGCLIPLAYILGVRLQLGLTGVWGAAVVYVLLLSAALIWRVRHGAWKHIEL